MVGSSRKANTRELNSLVLGAIHGAATQLFKAVAWTLEQAGFDPPSRMLFRFEIDDEAVELEAERAHDDEAPLVAPEAN